MHSEKIAVPLSNDLFSEIRHLTQPEQNRLFHNIVQYYVQKKKREQLIQDLRYGYEEMAELNLAIAEAFAYCEWEAFKENHTQKVTHY
ncbi:hypothetical protein [Geomicrobium sp. JCM 19039]|uniref:hypothetical protein n=1 Tax=Geomicrobium sp. JCM 19039 TaxID=1460636 RepID=UPI00045F305A|nr:hypothetical protein [Geomicrobium sp. JCM 19039]GAK11148.1 hypothetical protein JCM19039_824 [Geomicrobium sp. JCM 19039]